MPELTNKLVIVVQPNRWDAYGKPTFMNRLRYQLLAVEGGVSDSVPMGTYVFDVKLTLRGFVTELTPYKS